MAPTPPPPPKPAANTVTVCIFSVCSKVLATVSVYMYVQYIAEQDPHIVIVKREY
jgi:hypothetical protein